MQRIRHGVLGLALGFMVIGGTARAAEVAGDVLTLRGNCLLSSSGQSTALAVGTPVHVGDVIDVPADGRLKLHMADGSVISAASGTHLTIEQYAPGANGAPRDVRLGLAAGLLRAVVAVAAQPSTFEVETAVGVAAVRSTDWFVGSDKAGTQVGVLTGIVTLSDRAKQHTVSIPARWGARIRGDGLAPTPPRLWKDAEFADVIGRTDQP
ncbi:MAG: fecR family protein [Rhodospirillales bacterium]|jgi:hypothetical protein|nr:fecR family protein [Rhodospirillales bacterium]